MTGARTTITQNGQTEVSGLVTDSSGTCPHVAFKVNAMPVTVRSTTVFDDTTYGVARRNAAKAEVKGNKQGDGSILPTRVEIDN